MAMDTIDKALVTGFSEQVHHQAQQLTSRLGKLVMRKQVDRADEWAYDGLGDVEAREDNTRHGRVQFSDIEHTRRRIARRRFFVTLPVDKSDVRGALLNPDSEYAKACVAAMNRVFDRVVVEAAFATVKTGRTFGTDLTFANDNGDTINATAGLTYEKLLETSRLFLDDEVGTENGETMYLALTGDEHEDLMLETELTSGDFSRQFAIEKGQLTQALGYGIVKFGGAATNPILAVSGGVRDCIAASARAICVAVSKEMEISIEPRADLNETVQVQTVFELGAVRTEGKHIKKVQTTD